MDSRDWNHKYRESERLWSRNANQFVSSELSDLPPGRALDLAAGEGRNALWLADRGWQVTAIDFSDVAIDRGRQADPENRVQWLVADVLDFQPEPGHFDLVLLCYLHLPSAQMERVLGKARAALAPGGTLLVIGHDARNLEEGVGGPQDPAVLHSPEDVTRALGDLAIVRAETVEREVMREEGAAVALDSLVRAVRPR